MTTQLTPAPEDQRSRTSDLRRARMDDIPGLVPSKVRPTTHRPALLLAAPAACPFADRCGLVHDRCRRENPVRRAVGPGHDAACHWDHRGAAA